MKIALARVAGSRQIAAMTKAVLTITIAALVASPLAAQKDPPKASRIVDELAACRSITADAERLACFDRTAAALVAARADKQLVVVDREDVKKTKRSLFGFSLPKINLFGGGKDDDEPELKEIDATIKGVRGIANNLWVVTLDDNAQWQFTEPMTFPPKSGDPIKIKRGALGSYFGSVKGRLGIKIKRLN